MSILARLLGRGRTAASHVPPANGNDEPLVAVPIPPLVALLGDLERRKGAPLDEDEVGDIAARAVCMAMPRSAAGRMAEARGYDDIDPEHAWSEWQTLNGR